jgi:hypothetical protein
VTLGIAVLARFGIGSQPEAMSVLNEVPDEAMARHKTVRSQLRRPAKDESP